jgi:hypothetical protein
LRSRLPPRLSTARLAHVSQAREAALAVAVAELEAVYTSTPSDAQSLRLSGACRDQLSLLRHGVDAFELAAADEAEEAATEELRQRRAAFDRRVRPCACPPRSPSANQRATRRRLRVIVRDAQLAAHKAARDAAAREVRPPLSHDGRELL